MKPSNFDAPEMMLTECRRGGSNHRNKYNEVDVPAAMASAANGRSSRISPTSPTSPVGKKCIIKQLRKTVVVLAWKEIRHARRVSLSNGCRFRLQ